MHIVHCTYYELESKYEAMRLNDCHEVQVMSSSKWFDSIRYIFMFCLQEIIFKFMHLSLIIHSPKLDLLNASSSASDHFEKETEWYKSLRNYFYDVTLEMRAVSKKKNLNNCEPTMNDVFLQFAKRLCLMV
jgi:hypothetical protein